MSPLAQVWYDADMPEVSVVIVNFNCSDLTARCLRALCAHTQGHRYEIIVVDNGSRAEEVEKLNGLQPLVRLIALPNNVYFGAGGNLGSQAARGKFIVFLNNDAFVTHDWLSPLITTFDKCYEVGAVGPRLIWPDGRLQEAGSFIDDKGDSIQVGSNGTYHPLEEFQMRIVDYCSAACLVVPKKIFDDAGGFNSVYDPGYYEDVDLCLTIRSLGKFVYYCPASSVVHLLNATSNMVWTRSQLAEIAVASRDKFVERWGEFLRSRMETPVPVAAPRS
jgi:O-antigen biosynthesis protein